MGARGKQSAVSRETRPVVVQGGFGSHRADPPDDLTEEQKAIWRETVMSEPSDAFATAATKAMLKDYCRHRSEADRWSAVIDSFKTEWVKNVEGIKRMEGLSRLREKETRGAATLATKMRLTNQSRYTPHGAAAASRRTLKAQMPWEYDGEDEEAADTR